MAVINIIARSWNCPLFRHIVIVTLKVVSYVDSGLLDRKITVRMDCLLAEG